MVHTTPSTPPYACSMRATAAAWSATVELIAGGGMADTRRGAHSGPGYSASAASACSAASIPESARQKSQVEVPGVLTAEDRPGLGHRGLDERVAHPGADRRAAALGDDLGHGQG